MRGSHDAKINCELLSSSNLGHLQQLYTGFNLLRKAGLIRLTQKIADPAERAESKPPHLRDARRYHLTVVINRERVLYYDTHDSFEIDEAALSKVDFYFKRSYLGQEIEKFEDKHKIYPLGLNYEIYGAGPDLYLLRRIGLQTGMAKLRTLILGAGLDRLAKRRPYALRIGDFEFYPDLMLPPRILFMARGWDPAMAGSRDKADEIRTINDTRARCIRLLRKEFGELFFGGFVHEHYAMENFKDCLLGDPAAGRQNNYMSLLKRFPICIATTGLHGSIGWKLAEYVSHAKAIVTEKLNYGVPGPFKSGRNYLDFNSPEECVQASVTLVEDGRLRRELMMNNYRYHDTYVRPDSLILNTLATAVV